MKTEDCNRCQWYQITCEGFGDCSEASGYSFMEKKENVEMSQDIMLYRDEVWVKVFEMVLGSYLANNHFDVIMAAEAADLALREYDKRFRD